MKNYILKSDDHTSHDLLITNKSDIIKSLQLYCKDSSHILNEDSIEVDWHRLTINFQKEYIYTRDKYLPDWEDDIWYLLQLRIPSEEENFY